MHGRRSILTVVLLSVVLVTAGCLGGGGGSSGGGANASDGGSGGDGGSENLQRWNEYYDRPAVGIRNASPGGPGGFAAKSTTGQATITPGEKQVNGTTHVVIYNKSDGKAVRHVTWNTSGKLQVDFQRRSQRLKVIWESPDGEFEVLFNYPKELK